MRYMDFDIFMAEKEKAIIDCLALRNTPFSEVEKAIKAKEFNSKKLVEYGIKTKNISLMKRLGFLMERFGMNAEGLAIHLDSNYIHLDWSRGLKGKIARKWKIILNSDIE